MPWSMPSICDKRDAHSHGKVHKLLDATSRVLWTLNTALFFSAVLIVGSFTAVAVLGFVVGWLKSPWRK
jgi:hypothetical protein